MRKYKLFYLWILCTIALCSFGEKKLSDERYIECATRIENEISQSNSIAFEPNKEDVVFIKIHYPALWNEKSFAEWGKNRNNSY